MKEQRSYQDCDLTCTPHHPSPLLPQPQRHLTLMNNKDDTQLFLLLWRYIEVTKTILEYYSKRLGRDQACRSEVIIHTYRFLFLGYV